ncbi:hypothetical protein GWI33_010360 [Rhynchophorus ferrugineus]|uniref:Uncharacterized protein n=1 Tax=Rhynchophorus ferrugineus TaxID=354439 RepID=A0A834M956_RHYFE|nr:hypothetical protein GWI33_010360 [Rhynchophorus ferrugineus]
MTLFRCNMLAGPVRRCKKILPVTVVSSVILFLLIWRYTNRRENEIHPKHIFRENQEEYVDNNGIRVVIGHYVGNPVRPIPDATYKMINENRFNPQPNAGKNGDPVVIQSNDLVLRQQLYQINRFNLLASDKIPLNRSLPDYRRKR